MQDNPPNPQNEAEFLEQVQERIRVLDGRWTWLRDRIGMDEWTRLVKRRDRWIALNRARQVLLTYVALFGGIAFLSAVTDFVSGQVLLHAVPMGPILIVLAIVTMVSLGVWGATMYFRWDLQRLMLMGHNPEAVQTALWSEHQARILEATAPRIVEYERLQKATGYGPAWWHLELSGIHLVLWVALGIALFLMANPNALPKMHSQVIITFVLLCWLPKSAYWVFWLPSPPNIRLQMLKGYRWAATPVGLIVLLFVLPVFALVVTLALYGLAVVFGVR